jgi:hypothetical protein
MWKGSSAKGKASVLRPVANIANASSTAKPSMKRWSGQIRAMRRFRKAGTSTRPPARSRSP